MKQYYVYVMASLSRTLYIGMTNNLEVRVSQHKRKWNPRSFTAKYNVTRLVYYEVFGDSYLASRRERQLKGWRRSRKINLIESVNPDWCDLSRDWE